MNGKLILTGKVPFGDIPEYLAADIRFLPAYKNEIMMNIMPIKIYKYMVMGKPVIAMRLPGIMKELGMDNEVIYMDKPENALKKVIGARKENGLKAHRFVENNMGDDIVDDFVGLLEAI